MSEFEREREELMENEAPDLPFGKRPKPETPRNLGLWVVGILLALAIPLFYVAFGLAGALVATRALPIILVVAAFLFAVLGLGAVLAYTRIRNRYDRREIFHDDVGNELVFSRAGSGGGGAAGAGAAGGTGVPGGAGGPGAEIPGAGTVGAVMKTDVVVCGTLDSIYDCAKEMYEHNVGFLAVLDEHDQCVGVITDRDIVCAGVAQGADARTTPITTIMEPRIQFVGPRQSLADCLRMMSMYGIRRVPVIDGGWLVGVVSLDDLIAEKRVSIDEAALILEKQMQEPNAHHGLRPRVA